MSILSTLRRAITPTGHRGRSARISTRRMESAADDFVRDDFEGTGRYQGKRYGAASDDAELTEKERATAIKKSRRAYKQSGAYGAILDRMTDFVLGDGVAINVRDHASHEWLHEVLERPEIAWSKNLRARYLRLLVDGELPLLLRVQERTEGKASQNVSVGRLPVEGITRLLTPETNADDVVAVTYRADAGGAPLTYPIASPGAPMLRVRTTQAGRTVLAPLGDGPLVMLSEIPGTATSPIEQEKAAEVGSEAEPAAGSSDAVLAAVALWQVNTIGRRGAPLLTRILDKSDVLDQTVSQMARKHEYLNRHYAIAHYTPTGDAQKDEVLEKQLLGFLTGMSEGAALAKARDGRGQNSVEIDTKAPDLKTQDQSSMYELLLDFVLGAHGIPRMWYSSGGDTNRATAVEQGTPIFRTIKARQAELKGLVEDFVRWLLWIGSLANPSVKADAEIEVVMADLATRDSLRDVEEVAGVAVGVRELIDLGAITAAEGIAIVRQVLKSKAIGETLEHAQDGAGPTDDDEAPAVAVDGPTGEPETTLAPLAGGHAPDQEMQPPAGAVRPPVPAGADVAAGTGLVGEKPADAVWTGVQITALATLVEKVAAGLIPAESAIGIVTAAFPLTPEEARAIIGPAAAQEAETPEAPPPGDGEGDDDDPGSSAGPPQEPPGDSSAAPPGGPPPSTTAGG